MEMLCLCTFGQFGKIKGLSFNKIYQVRFSYSNRLLITNDFGRPQMVDSNNFVNWQSLKKYQINVDSPINL